MLNGKQIWPQKFVQPLLTRMLQVPKIDVLLKSTDQQWSSQAYLFNFGKLLDQSSVFESEREDYIHTTKTLSSVEKYIHHHL